MMEDGDSYNTCFAVILGVFLYFFIVKVPFLKFYMLFFSRLYFNAELNIVEVEIAVIFCIVFLWRLWT